VCFFCPRFPGCDLSKVFALWHQCGAFWVSSPGGRTGATSRSDSRHCTSHGGGPPSALLPSSALTGSARRWQIYGKELGFDRSWPQYCTYYFVGVYFNLVLPTSVGGDVLRVIYLNGQAGRNWPAFVSVLLERLNGLAVLIAFACVGLLFCPFALPWWILTGVLGSAAGAVLALVALRLRPAFTAIVRRSARSTATRRELAVLSAAVDAHGGPVDSHASCRHPRRGVPGVEHRPGCALRVCLRVRADAHLLMLLPISVGGMGVREGGHDSISRTARHRYGLGTHAGLPAVRPSAPPSA